MTICRGCSRVVREDGVPLDFPPTEKGDSSECMAISVTLCRECHPKLAEVEALERLKLEAQARLKCKHPSRRKAWERGRDFVVCEVCGADVEW